MNRSSVNRSHEYLCILPFDNQTTGECTCHGNVTGTKCDSCYEGYFDVARRCVGTSYSTKQSPLLFCKTFFIFSVIKAVVINDAVNFTKIVYFTATGFCYTTLVFILLVF